MRVLLYAIALSVLAMTSGPLQAQVLSFDQLDGWESDDHAQALKVFVQTCDQLDDPVWRPICGLARDTRPDAAKAFFELFFRPTFTGSPPALFTGYFEPELDGSPVRTPRFAYPIYRRPPDLVDGAPWYSRADIDGAGVLRGRGLEIAWLEDPVDVYFLQVQGSGRIRMPDGHVIRVGYAGKNNQPYRSIGQELVRRGIFDASEVSADVIQNWVRQNPGAGQSLMNTNPSFVFFRKIADLAPNEGPIGAMGRPIMAGRSVAIDPAHVPLGAPVWIEKDGTEPMRRLMIAQDTGGAIKGAQRADIFFGTGRKAGLDAGRIKDPGRLIVLMPIDLAFAMASNG
ncbi:murein transglycosylase A [Tabrizicola sp. J26]|uniref:murein transglycosylase A n=1 Tax=Alitabrizicola rongguiensis TaxID=2909234 RepID=UPI001F481A82|nr:murein transglycosylase A [Tabrizicola rongguiensis]MCF1708220.1 murein transglycosylase A [Tabrizicola rongguiensis]